MKRSVLCKVLLACLMVGLLAVAANADVVKVKVTNKTDAKVFIAFARTQTDSGGEDDDKPDSSKGWWSIDPGKTKTFKTYEYSPFHSVFYYATSKGGKRVVREDYGLGEQFVLAESIQVGEHGITLYMTRIIEIDMFRVGVH